MKKINKEKIEEELLINKIFATVDEVIENEPVLKIKDIIEEDPKSIERMPRVKIDRKYYSWEELGREIIAHEGFNIEINVYDPCLYNMHKKHIK